MIEIASNVVNLVSLLSGINAFFTHHSEGTVVKINAEGAGFKVTSDACPYIVEISCGEGMDGTLDVCVWKDGTAIHSIRSTATDVTERRDLRQQVLDILTGKILVE